MTGPSGFDTNVDLEDEHQVTSVVIADSVFSSQGECLFYCGLTGFARLLGPTDIGEHLMMFSLRLTHVSTLSVNHICLMCSFVLIHGHC